MIDPSKAPILVVAGPTASGKSALGIAIAEKVNGTIINADSMQVYRDLRVLTARPTDDEMRRAPHRLYGVLDGAVHGTAAVWVDLAKQAITETIAEGRVPILLGGTGMYLRSLFEGLAEIPPIPAEVRAEVRARLDSEGPQSLHAALKHADPDTAANLKPGDSQRLVRAWEVLQVTGRGLIEWQKAPVSPGLPNPAFRLLLQPPRDSLYARIDRRFEGMIDVGALDEAKAVLARGDIPMEAPMRKAHGLPELAQYLKGEISLEEAVRVGQLNTRHYAKRQTTWFRHQFSPDLVVEKDLSQQENFNLEAEIFPFIVRYLLTAR
ncbi:tRNA (adenosine(37)-N6)-dimethylallyltransferase MiaA [Ferrovibrio terrae]|uniref:tRNA dimethylallyltransferase n=1 Tax=Ferrovibrio terrae TaxID=2594003 RepID=A0A516GWP3_9PROT|nr:tRNA (adenosine(37)-N6)-dimethylallyltransferase MiaA [Ferrovibrio terrae]QDO95947.1 tRNA (adenosine(37)-N6)-dimethylallyltransferase MiaA [Ferrovibrio terrae]